VLPRGAAVRAGEPGPPAHHVERGAHAHQRPADQTAQQMPAPAQPPLFASSRLGRKASASDLSLAMKTETTKTQSVNEVSISMMEPR
jgi:hypothetical protein